MKDCGVKKIYKTPDVALIETRGDTMLAASGGIDGYDAEVSDTNWFGGADQ